MKEEEKIEEMYSMFKDENEQIIVTINDNVRNVLKKDGFESYPDYKDYEIKDDDEFLKDYLKYDKVKENDKEEILYRFSNEGGKPFLIIKDSNGSITCNCPAFKYKNRLKKEGEKTKMCSHLIDYFKMLDGEIEIKKEPKEKLIDELILMGENGLKNVESILSKISRFDKEVKEDFKEEDNEAPF